MCKQQSNELKRMVERALLTGMSTDGIDRVPTTGTFPLDRGERVIAADSKNSIEMRNVLDSI